MKLLAAVERLTESASYCKLMKLHPKIKIICNAVKLILTGNSQNNVTCTVAAVLLAKTSETNQNTKVSKYRVSLKSVSFVPFTCLIIQQKDDL